jgi:hypothetical protein
MSRAGVRPDIAERTLGHAIAGVEGVYDRHHYAIEKADALARLATLIQSRSGRGRRRWRCSRRPRPATASEESCLVADMVRLRPLTHLCHEPPVFAVTHNTGFMQ